MNHNMYNIYIYICIYRYLHIYILLAEQLIKPSLQYKYQTTDSTSTPSNVSFVGGFHGLDNISVIWRYRPSLGVVPPMPSFFEEAREAQGK